MNANSDHRQSLSAAAAEERVRSAQQVRATLERVLPSPVSSAPVPPAPRFTNTEPAPVAGVCTAIGLGETSSDTGTNDVVVAVHQAIDRMGSDYCVNIEAPGVSLNLPEDSIADLIVMLTAARVGIDLDKAARIASTRTSHDTVGHVTDVSKRPFHIGAQRFQWEGAPAEHNVLIGGFDDAFSVEQLPEFVRLLMSASRTACVPGVAKHPEAVDLDVLLDSDPARVREGLNL